ncbi:MAG TPA: response regulator, partial [Micavibrio sp.]
MKLSDPVLMKSVLETTAPPQMENYQKHVSSFQMMKSLQFEFRTIDEAERLASFLANFFPEPERVIQGLAELMFNAIEHGNLGIGYETKVDLCRRGNWHNEIQQRLESPGYYDRVAEVALSRKDGGIYVVITDQGEGF